LKYINLNGKISIIANAIIPVDNGAFRYGYGLYETMMIENGTIRFKDYHWERLFAGLRQLYFDIPSLMTPEWLEEEVLCIVKKNQAEKLCRVRLQMFAGEGGLYSSDNNQPGFIIECLPLDKDMIKFNENGLLIGVATDLSKSTDGLSNLKSCNALIYAMGARQAREHKWNDALITNTDGNIIESMLANIFWVKDKVVYTPPLSDGCVAGVMRRHIISTIGTIKEQSLSKEALLDADEVFLTNAIKKIRWVGAMEDKKYDNKITKAIYGQI
jgi:branched-chain amino acid aminotransferase